MFIANQFKRINSRIRFRIPDAGFGTYLYCYLDYIFCKIFFGAGIIEYFEFGYYSKSLIEKANNFSKRKRNKILKKCVKDPKTNFDLYDDKIKFNKFFDRLLFRDWMDISNSSFEDFDAFFKKYNSIMVKDAYSLQGKGVKRYDYTNVNMSKELYDELTGSGKPKVLAEELIVQHHELMEFSKAVCTMRIITLTLNNEVNFICGAIRFGVGESDVDNMGSGGIAADISLEEGLVISCAENEQGEKFYYHPTSGKKIIGFKIPNWDKVLEVTKEAALMNPDHGYIGWDVAVTEDNAVIVEGNNRTGVIQISALGSYGKVKKAFKKKR